MKRIEISQPSENAEPNDEDCTTANEDNVTATGVLISGGRRPLPVCRIRDAEPSSNCIPPKADIVTSFQSERLMDDLL